MDQPWMLFRACKPSNEHAFTNDFFFWNGRITVPVRTEQHTILIESYPGELIHSDDEQDFLNEIALSKRKHKFKSKRMNRSYEVEARGVFKEI